MKKFQKMAFVFFLSLLFSGCNLDFPDLTTEKIEEKKVVEKIEKQKKIEVKEVKIKKNEKKNIKTVAKSEEKKSWTEENFPKNCAWVEITEIVDGDTIWVDKIEKVRFIGIDTPETKHPKKPVDPLGLEATKLLEKLLVGEEKICLIFDKKTEKRDFFKRILAYPFRSDGLDISLVLLKHGHAEVYLKENFTRKEEFILFKNSLKK